jgi:iron(III) transport system permease protein
MSATTSASEIFAPRRSFVPVLFVGMFVLLAVVALLPLLTLIYASLTAGENVLPSEAHGITLQNYVRTFADPSLYTMLGMTVIFAVGSTAIGIAIAVFFAWMTERTDAAWRAFFFVAIITPMAIPNMIYALAWTQLLNPNNGLINDWVHALGIEASFDVFTLAGMILVQGLAIASHSFLLIAAAFRTLDPTWEEQSAIAGKGRFATVRRVVLPALKPALLAAVIFFLVVSMETFDIPGTLGLTSRIHLLSTQIFWATHPEGGGLPDYGIASTLSVLLVGAALILISFYQRQVRHSARFVTITAKGYGMRRVALGEWRWPIFALAMVIVLFAAILPIFMLVWRSLISFYAPPSLDALANVSLAAYASLFENFNLVMVSTNTAIVTLVSGFVVVAIASLAAWLILRADVSAGMRRQMQGLAFLPQSIPSIVIGFSLVLVFISAPVAIYGTVWIIAFGMIIKYIAYSTGMMSAAQMQVARELEEASSIAGAGFGRTYRRIVLPLLAPALINCLLWVMVHVVRDLSIPLMLYTPESEVISTKVWTLWENGSVPEAAALGVLTVLVLAVLLGAGRLAFTMWRRA